MVARTARDHFAGKVRTIDMWGFAESQETVGVSPRMFAEFIFPDQLPILERFGLNCYGYVSRSIRALAYRRKTPRLASGIRLGVGPTWRR